MVAFLYILSLVIAAVSVSVLGAAFSISGLSRLFAGSALAITMMASALEFSKFVVAAFLHRTWYQLNIFYRYYLLSAVVVLSVITSMGIFGFLSDSYQTSSVDLVSNQIKIDAMKAEQQRNSDEISRINKSIDEIPASRISKKIQARKESEPLVRELSRKTEVIADQIKQMDLKILDVKTKVGPLIYVARAFNQDIDTVVKWLILIFVSVFDPLAICLVIATSEALKLNSMGLLSGHMFARGKSSPAPVPAQQRAQVTVPAASEPVASEPVVPAPVESEPALSMPSLEIESPAAAPAQPQPQATRETVAAATAQEPIRMRFIEDDSDKKAS